MDRLILLVESRIRGDVYVRFGGELPKTHRSNTAGRWMLSLLLKVIRKMDIMCVKITMKNIFSLFVCLKKCCNFAVLQLTIKYANGIFYARKETYILKYRQTISVYHRPMAMVGCSKLGYLSAFLFNNK